MTIYRISSLIIRKYCQTRKQLILWCIFFLFCRIYFKSGTRMTINLMKKLWNFNTKSKDNESTSTVRLTYSNLFLDVFFLFWKIICLRAVWGRYYTYFASPKNHTFRSVFTKAIHQSHGPSFFQQLAEIFANCLVLCMSIAIP